MHSFAQTNGQYQQIGPLQQASQAAPHPPHEATRTLSANNPYQYMTVNSGVQPSQSANFGLQHGSYVEMQMAAGNMKKPDVVKGNPLLKMLLIEPEQFLNSQSQNSPQDSHGSQLPTQQNCLYSTNQSLSNATNPNTTYPQQNMTVHWTQSAAVNERQTVKTMDVSHYQQYTASQSSYQNPNVNLTRPLSSYTAAAPSPPQQQMVNTNAPMSAGSQNVQVSQVAPNQFGRNGAEGRYASAYESSWNGVTSQPYGNRNVSSQTFSNGQVPYVLNQSQRPQQQTNYPCSSYSDCGNPNNSRSTNMINHSNSNFSLVKTNEVPLNHAGGSQQMLRHHVSADSLSNVRSVSLERYPPPYGHQHLISIPNMSKQNVQPVTSARSESYTINATHSASLGSGQSLPQSVMSRGQLTVNPPPQQTQKPLHKDYHINSKQDKQKRKMATDPLPSNRIISKECPVILPSMCSPVKQKDNASHSMLGHTSTRAVAVVPPLSQEIENTFFNIATCESVVPAEKTCITPDLAKGAEATYLREESDLNQKKPSPIEASTVTSNLGAVLTTSDSESQRSPESPAHKPSTVPASQTCSKEPASPPVLQLSSLPTNAWTAEALNKLIMETEQDYSKPQEYSVQNFTVKFLIMFWDRNIRKLIQYIKAHQSGTALDFENLNIDISDKSVILSEVKPDFKDHLKHYRVLDDGEVYSEQPYKSLWLNVNHQLDDIDKEFGFPWTLKQHLCVNETDSQIDPPKTEHSIPEPIVKEVHNKALSLTEPEMVDRVEEKASTVECSPSPPTSQNESEDSSSESDHSFKIEVLPPETAKSIFEQVQKLTPQRTDCENGMVSSGSLQTGISKDADSSLNTSTVENKSDDKIKEICCLAKLMEMYSISDVPSSKCLCNVEQSCNGQTVKTPNPDSNSSAKGNKDTDCQTITLSSSELCSKLEQIIDLTDEDELDQSSEEFEVDEDQESGIISQISNGNLLNIVIKSESEDNDVSTPDFAIASSASSPFTLEISETESEDNCPPDQLNSAASIPTNASVSSAKQTESESEAVNVLQLSDQGEYHEPAHLQLTEEDKLPLESKQKTQTTSYSYSVKDDKPTKKKPRQSRLDHFFPDLKTSKCKGHTDLDLLDVPVAQPQSSEVKTVELVLFGSGQREGLVPENEKNKPPEVLSVNLDQSRRKSLEADCPRKYSAKHLIYERWRKTFPPNMSGSNMKGFKNKLKRQKRLSVSLPSTSSTHQQSASFEVQIPDALNKNRLSLKRRRSLSLIRRHEKIKRRRYSVSLEKPATEGENGTLSRKVDNMPSRENIVLKFSVLPNTFHFPDGSSGTKKTSYSDSDMPALEDENQSLKKTIGKSKAGSWCLTTEKQYKPLRAPQTVSLFHEYQKKYKEKTQICTDESSDK